MNSFLLGDINLKIETDIIEKKFVFKWIIQGINGIPETVRSNRFSPVDAQIKDWYATASLLKGSNEFKVSLTYDSEDPTPVRIEHTSCAMDAKATSLGGTCSKVVVFKNRGEELVLLDRISCPDVGCPAEPRLDKAVFECSMSVYGLGLNTTCDTFDTYDKPDMDVVEFQDAFRKMLSDDEFSDLKINVGSKCFSAHRCVLVSRTPAFLEYHIEDIMEGKLNLMNIDVNIFQRLLSYVYTGETGELPKREDYRRLYPLAHRYKLEGLKRLCAKAMAEDFTVDNVIDVFSIAEDHKDEELLVQCRVFMRRHLDVLSTKVEWNRLISYKLHVLEDVMKVHQ